VADDQEAIRFALQMLLNGAGYASECVAAPDSAVAAVERGGIDLVLMDLNYSRDTTSGSEGLELLPRLRATAPDVPVVVMTAWATIDLAIEAMRRGASDFVLKPWENAALLDTVRTHVQRRAERALDDDRVNRDLALARRVQGRLLPQSCPALATLEYAGYCLEAHAVGGDGYDFIPLGGNRMALTLADASGKGIGAALLMANLQGAVRSVLAAGHEDLVSMLDRLNAVYLGSTAPEHYATLFAAIYDDAGRRLRYVNCGHNPPVLLRRDGSCERLGPTAPVVGLIEGWRGEARDACLDPGDLLVVYSDGVTEARGDNEEEFGDDRLVATLRGLEPLPVPEIPRALAAAVAAFTKGAHGDDLTVVVARGR
jgi:sigma-B regulation protein RsbU (phosphoserine phosphatase)